MLGSHWITIFKNGRIVGNARINVTHEGNAFKIEIAMPPVELSPAIIKAIEQRISQDETMQMVGGINVGTELYSWRVM